MELIISLFQISMSVSLTLVLMASAKMGIISTRVSVILDGLGTTAMLVSNTAATLNRVDSMHIR